MGNAILVVDDERNFRTGIQFFLEENGYAVDQAATGSEALLQLRENSYQAVLLDLLLPDVEGIELAEFITLNHPDTAVVILTGNGSINTAVRAVRYGVVDYLQKPCRPELVLQILARGIESKRLKKELIASRYTFEQLAAATWEGIAFFSDDRLTQCNPQFWELFHIAEPTAETPHHLQEFVKDWQACMTLLQQCPTGEPSIFESIGFYGDGTSFPLEIRLRKMREKGELSWVAAFRDISARKQDEMSRLKMQEELTNAQRMKSIGLMAGSVAHDLNNILTAIVTFPELLLMKMESTEKYREDIDLIRKAGQQAAAVVADLLTVTRGATSQKESCNLNDIIESYKGSLDYIQLEREYPNAEITFRLHPQVAAIEASPVHLTKTLINLLANGIEAAGPSGSISITTETRCLQKMKEGYEIIPPGAFTVLSVRDSGPGISEADLPRLFEPFFSRKKLGRSGTGLGLTVIWNTIRDHHGYIDIHNTPGGCCFELYFPITQKTATQLTPSTFTHPPVGNGEKILVVDDEKGQLEVTAALLKRLGYTPITAGNGQSAVDYLHKEPVDLLLLDLWMEPGINGYETYRKAKKLRADQKAILTSGYFRPEDKATSQTLGIRQHLTKPYSIQALAHALHDELQDPS
ncbi:hybrid sensor histidine kinase/response regulator [Desulfopila aestuarii]|uniref:histidine kinase n=1 Tax=Desulfopila aestuarii DSM 18488 TaxID=1121416 RepID=A0A1M7YEL6_9BACT|nr:response regulator [Desulfopila aestuarii]SHO51070.1 His Kinase A (phospho-acceptor) domain-containing protein [Desulfopila aestuarii DSM 18488]